MSWMWPIVASGAPGTTAPPTTAAPGPGSGVDAVESIANYIEVATDASGDTMGSWVELNASTPKEYNGVLITVARPSPGNVSMLIDIGVGAAGFEAVIVEALPLRSNTVNDESGYTIFIPLRIEESSRVVARAQSGDGSDTCRVSMHGCDNSNQLFENCITFGDDKANSTLTEYDPGAVADTKGSWTELVAETDDAMAYIGLMAALSNLSVTTCHWFVDIGVGDAGSEQVVAEDLYVGTHSNFDKAVPALIGMFPLDIPSGSRIAVRASCTITDATDRIIDLAVIGAY